MPGQCYSCGAEFGIFKKEHGCKNCGFAFCSKCLAEKSIAVPKRNNSKHHVCVKCYKLLSGQAKPPDPSQQSYDLPEAYLKRVAALKEKESSQPKAKGKEKVPAQYQKLDKPDRDIAMRLEKLKEAKKPKEQVTDKDINVRLAQLKGQNYVPDAKPVYKPPDRRLPTQQVEDLLDEIAAEVEIDSHRPDPVQDVEARLAHLRSTHQDARPNKQEPSLENNLNKSDFVGGPGKPVYNKNITTDSSASGEENNVNLSDMQRLMDEVSKETDLDAEKALRDMQRDEELMGRLREVQQRRKKGQGEPEGEGAEGEPTAADNSGLYSAESVHDDDSDDDEAEAKRIIQRYLEEAKIDQRTGNDVLSEPKATDAQSSVSGYSDSGSESDFQPDEFEVPFCCICEQDPVVRCRDCEYDIFCNRCFRDCHQKMDILDHRTLAYKAPKEHG